MHDAFSGNSSPRTTSSLDSSGKCPTSGFSGLLLACWARQRKVTKYVKMFFSCFNMPIKYMQIGNAVAIPVARALGYSLAMSCKCTASEEPVFSLPKKFPIIEEAQ
ncbi:Bromo adjacent homology (BAH) domain-containing protein [Artemisia annua]|uniref:Bromo adjacent homology (BAH) domain-containing protein n=1 Tax=Artemisia annua TaxID=35608 RepID=A0A2U1MR57_ARTAN|nr:Bromo adjacent homology (BAH) domain-containing protein [Artemisia annua]